VRARSYQCTSFLHNLLLQLLLLQLNQPRLLEDLLIEPYLVLVHQHLHGAGVSTARARGFLLDLPLDKTLVLTERVLTLFILKLLVFLV